MKTIRDHSLHYLTYRDRTVQEMKQHLRQKGFDAAQIEEEIEALRQLHLLDDRRFCQLYMESSFAKGRGLLRIRRELQQKGVSAFDWEDALHDFEKEWQCDITEEERKRAMQMGEQMIRENEADEKSIARLGRRLRTLGYETSLIYDVIHHIRGGK